jgi:hypothetical protein
MKPADVRGMFIGYVASRYDSRILLDLGFNTFAGFSSYAANVVGANVNSIKNWRDEFDGLNPDPDRKRKAVMGLMTRADEQRGQRLTSISTLP